MELTISFTNFVIGLLVFVVLLFSFLWLLNQASWETDVISSLKLPAIEARYSLPIERTRLRFISPSRAWMQRRFSRLDAI
jgi:hypothetical protein